MIKKHQVALFLETGTGTYTRMSKSTQLTLALNPETETYDYITDESPTDELMKYKISIDQDLRTIKGNADYEYIFGKMFNLEVGETAKTNALIVFMAEESTPTNFKAWKSECTISINDYDAVASTINFSILFGGTVARGNATITEGTPTFTPEV